MLILTGRGHYKWYCLRGPSIKIIVNVFLLYESLCDKDYSFSFLWVVTNYELNIHGCHRNFCFNFLIHGALSYLHMTFSPCHNPSHSP